MQEKNFIPRQNGKKQTRFVLSLVFGASLGLIFLTIAYREAPRVWQKINEPGVAVSEKLTPVVPTATPTPKFENEKKVVEEMITPLRGEYGVYFEEIETQESFFINGEEKFTAASLIKMPMILTLYREAEAGRVNLDEIYKLKAADKREGAGALQYKPVGFEISLRKMAELMGKQSDNTAFNVISQIAGAEKIQATIEALGMKNTSYAEI